MLGIELSKAGLHREDGSTEPSLKNLYSYVEGEGGSLSS
jgi:hypothetical protein